MFVRPATTLLVGALVAAFTTALPSGLERRNGGFLELCQDDYLEIRGGTMLLSTECRNEQGESSRTSLDLNQCVGNQNGKLLCTPQGYFYLSQVTPKRAPDI